MKLTVGPLPSAVYWRRRAGVLGGLLLALFVLFYSCSGGSPERAGSGASRSTAAVPAPGASGTGSAAEASASAVPAAPAATAGDLAGATSAAAAADVQACTDAEITVTAVPEATSAPSGSYIKFWLKIKNVSNRSCSRDIGADAQELYLQDSGNAKVWSSDTCDAPHGTEVKTFEPALEVSFFVIWNGRASSSGCTNRPVPPAGQYQLVGRLASKLSAPVPIQLS